MEKLLAIAILAWLAMAAMHPNNRYHSPETAKPAQAVKNPPA
jgi:hypothetical protein